MAQFARLERGSVETDASQARRAGWLERGSAPRRTCESLPSKLGIPRFAVNAWFYGDTILTRTTRKSRSSLDPRSALERATATSLRYFGHPARGVGLSGSPSPGFEPLARWTESFPAGTARPIRHRIPGPGAPPPSAAPGGSRSALIERSPASPARAARCDRGAGCPSSSDCLGLARERPEVGGAAAARAGCLNPRRRDPTQDEVCLPRPIDGP